MEDFPQSQERRKHPRYLIDLPLNFQMTENSHIYTGLSINASETGLLIQAFQDIPIGVRLNIELLFPKDYELSNLEGTAQIIWKDQYVWNDYEGYKYGLQFIQISNESYDKLRLLLGSLFNPEDNPLYQPA